MKYYRKQKVVKLSNVFTLTVLIFSVFFIINGYADKPITIPSLKEWKDTTGVFNFNSESRIIVDTKYKDQLTETAKTFRDDLKALMGVELIISNDLQAQPNDIFLTLSSVDSTLGKEGYSLLITGSIIVDAMNETGVFYGTRTILQLLKQSDTIKGGFARDWPDYKERGMMIDAGRKFFSIDWIKNHIKEMSYLKLNYFHLHLSDNEGFRLECTSHPEIQSSQIYSKSEMTSILDLARKYHVIIVPEIDMPNHLYQILKNHESYWLKDSAGGGWSTLLDITSDSARAFAKEIMEEYLDFFPGPYWHMGADEFVTDYNLFSPLKKYAIEHYGSNAIPQDVLFGFINWVDSIVREHGKTLRIWNDSFNKAMSNGSTVKINKDIVVEYYNGDTIPQKLMDAGYSLMNCHIILLCYDVGTHWRPNDQYMYKSWRPDKYIGNQEVQPGNPKNLGSKFPIWCDMPQAETEMQIGHGIYYTLRVMAQVNWDSRYLDTNFAAFTKKADSLGSAPGVEFSQILLPNDLAFGKKVYASSVKQNTDYLPDLVVDGDYNTYWESNPTDTEWIYVDLGEKCNLTRVKLNWYDSYAVSYQIQTSDNAIDWKTMVQIDSSNGGIDDYPDLSGNGRYIRIFCTKSATHHGFSLFEYEIYDSNSIKTNYQDILNSNQNCAIKCFPNPFNSALNVIYSIEKPSYVKLVIMDLSGIEVAELVNENKLPGNYQITWNADKFPSGVYFCHFIEGIHSVVEKLILIK